MKLTLDDAYELIASNIREVGKGETFAQWFKTCKKYPKRNRLIIESDGLPLCFSDGSMVIYGDNSIYDDYRPENGDTIVSAYDYFKEFESLLTKLFPNPID